MRRTGRVKKFAPILPYSGLILHIWLCGEKHLQSFFFLQQDFITLFATLAKWHFKNQRKKTGVKFIFS